MDFKQFVAAMFEPFGRLTDFSGRSTRAQFWPFIFLTYAVPNLIMFGFIGSLMDGVQKQALAGPDAPLVYDFKGLFINILIVSGISFLVFALPLAGAVIRRLHDTDRTGFWALPAVFLQFFGFFLMWKLVQQVMALQDGDGIPSALLPLVGNNLLGLGYSILLLVYFAQDGTVGPNRYGPDPKVRDTAGPGF